MNSNKNAKYKTGRKYSIEDRIRKKCTDIHTIDNRVRMCSLSERQGSGRIVAITDFTKYT